MSVAQGNDAEDRAIRWIAKILAQNYTDGACDSACGAICDCFGRERVYAYRGARLVHAEMVRRTDPRVKAMESKLAGVCDIVRELEKELHWRNEGTQHGINGAKVAVYEHVTNRIRRALGMPAVEAK